MSGDGGITVDDALIVFSLGADYDTQALKARYRRVVLNVHPDRGGTEELFRTVNDCYRILAEDLQARTGGTLHGDLKRAYTADVERYDVQNRRGGERRKEDFDGAWFNEVFEKTRVRDETRDGGYGDWFLTEEPAAPHATLNPKCGAGAFNRAFESAVPAEQSRAIVVRPDPLVLGCTLGFTELGIDGVEEYDVAVGGGLVGYDCKKAHREQRTGSAFDGEQAPLSAFDERALRDRRARDLERGLTDAELEAERKEVEKASRRDAARRHIQLRTDTRQSEATYRADMLMLRSR